MLYHSWKTCVMWLQELQGTGTAHHTRSRKVLLALSGCQSSVFQKTSLTPWVFLVCIKSKIQLCLCLLRDNHPRQGRHFPKPRPCKLLRPHKSSVTCAQLVIQHNGGTHWSSCHLLSPFLMFYLPCFTSTPLLPPSWCLCHITKLMRWEALLL